LTTLITNDGNNNLKSRLQELIKISEEVKILVGYFHFSGIKELHEILKKLYDEGKLSQGHIKILVGLYNNTDEYGDMKNKDKFIQNLIDSIQREFERLNNAEDIYEQVKFFIKLLEEKIITIRKAKDPNHSKLYLFTTKKISAPYVFIVGSSNLTNSGLLSQNELNVEINNYNRFKEAEKYFDDLWRDAITLSEDDVRKLIYKIKNETTFKKKISLNNKEVNNYRKIAIEYNKKREYQEGIRYFQKSIEIYEKNEDYRNASISKLDLGDTYRKMKDYENAEKYLSEGLEGIKKVGDKYWEAMGYWYFGWFYRYKKDKEIAREYYHRAHNLFVVIGAEKMAKIVLNDMENLDKDLSHYNESSSLQTNKKEKAHTYNHIVIYKKKYYREAIRCF
jgi:tetratricopeptide (TPR) repeat protein